MRILLIIFLLNITATAFAQNVGKETYEKAIDHVNCALAELSILEQDEQPNLLDFREQVQGNCTFVNLVVFLKTRKPQPLEKNIFLANVIDNYKSRYSSALTNQDLYDLLSIDLFRKSEIVNFRKQPKRAKSYPQLKRNINDYLTTVFKITPTITRSIDEDTDEPEAQQVQTEEDTDTNPTDENSIKMPEEPEAEIPVDYYKDIEEYNDDNDMDWAKIFSWRRSWLFRFSLFFLSMAAFLYVVIPYYEKSYKEEETKHAVTGDKGIILPEAMGLNSKVALLKNKNKVLLENIKSLHFELDELEDE